MTIDFIKTQQQLQDDTPSVSSSQLEIELRVINELAQTGLSAEIKEKLLQYINQPWYWLLRSQISTAPVQEDFEKIQENDIINSSELLSNIPNRSELATFYTTLNTHIREYTTTEKQTIDALRVEQPVNISKYITGLLNGDEDNKSEAINLIKTAIKFKLAILDDAAQEELAQQYLPQLITPQLSAEQQALAKANAYATQESAYARLAADKNFDRHLAEQRLEALRAYDTNTASLFGLNQEARDALKLHDALFERIYQAELTKLDPNFDRYLSVVNTINDTLSDTLLDIHNKISAALTKEEPQHVLLKRKLHADDGISAPAVEAFYGEEKKPSAFNAINESRLVYDHFKYYFAIEEIVRQNENLGHAFLDDHESQNNRTTISDMAAVRKEKLYAISRLEYETLTRRAYPTDKATGFAYAARLLNDADRAQWANQIGKGTQQYKEQRDYFYVNVIYPVFKENSRFDAEETLRAKLIAFGITDKNVQAHYIKQFLSQYDKVNRKATAVVDANILSESKKSFANGYEELAKNNKLAQAEQFIKKIVLEHLDYDANNATYGKVIPEKEKALQNKIKEILNAISACDVDILTDGFIQKYSLSNDALDDEDTIPKTQLYNKESADITAKARNKTWRFSSPLGYNSPSAGSASFSPKLKQPIRKGETNDEAHKRRQASARFAINREVAARFLESIKTIVDQTNVPALELQRLKLQDQAEFNKKLAWAQKIQSTEYHADRIRHMNQRDQAHLNNINTARKNIFTKFGNRAGTTAGIGTALTTLFVISSGFLGMSTLGLPFVALLAAYGFLWLIVDQLIDQVWPWIQKEFFTDKKTGELELLESEKFKITVKSVLMVLFAVVATVALLAVFSFAWYLPLIAGGIFISAKFMNVALFKKMTAGLINKFATLDENYKLKWYLGYVNKFNLTPGEKAVLQASLIGNILMGILYASLTYLKISTFMNDNLREFMQDKLGSGFYSKLCKYVDFICDIPYIGPVLALPLKHIPEIIAFAFAICIFFGYAILTTEGMARIVQVLNQYIGTPIAHFVVGLKNAVVGLSGFLKVLLWNHDLKEAKIQLTNAWRGYFVKPSNTYFIKPVKKVWAFFSELTLAKVGFALLAFLQSENKIWQNATQFERDRKTVLRWDAWTFIAVPLFPLIIPAAIFYLVTCAKRLAFGEQIDNYRIGTFEFSKAFALRFATACFNLTADYGMRKPLHQISALLQVIFRPFIPNAVRKYFWSIVHSEQKIWHNATQYTPVPREWNVWTFLAVPLFIPLLIPAIIVFAITYLKRLQYNERLNYHPLSGVGFFNFIADYGMRKPLHALSGLLQMVLRPIIPFALPIGAVAGATALLTVSADSASKILQGSPEKGEEPTGLDKATATAIIEPILIASILVKTPLVLAGAFDVVEHLNKDHKISPHAQKLVEHQIALKAAFGSAQNDFIKTLSKYKELTAEGKHAEQFNAIETILKLVVNAALQSELALYDEDEPENYMDYQEFRDYLYGGGAFAQSLSLAMLSKLGFEGGEALIMIQKITRHYKKLNAAILNEYTENNASEAINLERRKELKKFMTEVTVNNQSITCYKRIPDHVIEAVKREKSDKTARKAQAAQVRHAEDALDTHIRKKENSWLSSSQKRGQELREVFNHKHPSTATNVVSDPSADDTVIDNHQRKITNSWNNTKVKYVKNAKAKPTDSRELFDAYTTALAGKAIKL